MGIRGRHIILPPMHRQVDGDRSIGFLFSFQAKTKANFAEVENRMRASLVFLAFGKTSQQFKRKGRPVFHYSFSGWLLPAVMIVSSVLAGCAQSQVVELGGGEPPVTAERLMRFGKLQHITAPIMWNFDKKTVAIVFHKGAPAATVLEPVLEKGIQPQLVTASWEIAGQKLCLRELEVDGKSIDDELKLELRPAGPIRVNIGAEQYNMMRAVTKDQLIGKTIEHDGAMVDMRFSKEGVKIVTHDAKVARQFGEQLSLDVALPKECTAKWKLEHGILRLSEFRIGDSDLEHNVSLDLSGVTRSRIHLSMEDDADWDFRLWHILGIGL